MRIYLKLADSGHTADQGHENKSGRYFSISANVAVYCILCSMVIIRFLCNLCPNSPFACMHKVIALQIYDQRCKGIEKGAAVLSLCGILTKACHRQNMSALSP